MLDVRLYALLDPERAGGRDLAALGREVVAGGATLVQLRDKHGSTRRLIDETRAIKAALASSGVPVLVNDRVDVALAARADAVHLGQTDLPIEAARSLAGARLRIGVSTHDVAQVERAVAAGADYLGFGPIFATTTKANPDPVQGLDGLRAAVAAARGVPIVAIGGIAPEHARAIYAAGASAICAISAVNSAADPAAAARRFAP